MSQKSKTHRAENVLMLDLHSDGSLPRRTRPTNFMRRSFCVLKRGDHQPLLKVMVTRLIQKISGGCWTAWTAWTAWTCRLKSCPSPRSYWMKMRKAKHLGSCWLSEASNVILKSQEIGCQSILAKAPLERHVSGSTCKAKPQMAICPNSFP